jgi:hypothetical protein
MRGHCIYFWEEVCLIWWEIVGGNCGGEKTVEARKPADREIGVPGGRDYWMGAPKMSASRPIANRITPD